MNNWTIESWDSRIMRNGGSSGASQEKDTPVSFSSYHGHWHPRWQVKPLVVRAMPCGTFGEKAR